jgi:hypothetical protein
MKSFMNISDRKFILVFFDNILIYNQKFNDHPRLLQAMFELSRSYKLVAKVNKCIFYSDSVEFLRHIIFKTGVATTPKKIQAIVN